MVVCCRAKEPVFRCSGPFAVQLTGISKSPWAPQRPGDERATHYGIRVYGKETQHMVYRRYSDFEKLLKAFPDVMTPMPPKSVFRIRCRCLEYFKEERMLQLEKVLCAIVSHDPLAQSAALCGFLSINMSPDRPSWCGSADSWRTLCSTAPLEAIEEGSVSDENDEEDDLLEDEGEENRTVGSPLQGQC